MNKSKFELGGKLEISLINRLIRAFREFFKIRDELVRESIRDNNFNQDGVVRGHPATKSSIVAVDGVFNIALPSPFKFSRS